MKKNNYKKFQINIISFLTNILFFLIPLMNSPSLVSKTNLIKGIILFLMIIIVFIKFFLNKKFFFGKKIKFLLLWLLLFDFYILILSFFNSKYLSSLYVYEINMSIIFLNFGNLLNSDKKIIKNLKFYLLGVMILSIDVYLNYFKNINLNITGYLYGSKNGIGPIIAMSIIISQHFKNNYSNKLKKIIDLGDIFKLILLTLMKNRSGLLALILVYIIPEIYKFIKLKKNKFKKLLILITTLIIIISKFDKIYFYLKWSFGFMHKRAGVNTLDLISSGRYSLYKYEISKISDSILIGTGDMYVDNFYLCFLRNYGLIGILIISLLLMFFIKYYSNKKSTLLSKTNKRLIIYVFIITFFEALPPFGPGGTYFIFWFLLGSEMPLITKFRRRKNGKI